MKRWMKYLAGLGIIVLCMENFSGCGKEQQEVQVVVQEPLETESGKEDENGKAVDAGYTESTQVRREETIYGERVVLTLGSFFASENEELMAVIDAYNQQSETYYVEFVDYAEGFDGDVDAALERFKIELGRGKGPDIIEMTGLEKEVLGAAGVLADLYKLMSTADRENTYVTNILRCAQTGEALYSIAPSFNFYTMYADGELAGMESGWTFEEFVAFCKANGKGAEAVYGFSVDETVMTTLGRFAVAEYIDWEQKTVSFDNEGFYQMLEFNKDRTEANLEYVPYEEGIIGGYYLAEIGSINSIEDYMLKNAIYGGSLAVKGFPTGEGTGVSIQLLDQLGISSKSASQQGAWDFVSFYLQEYSGKGFPIRQNALDDMFAASMQEEISEGEKVPKVYCTYGEGEKVVIYAATQEDVEAVRQMIDSADRCASYNTTLMLIIEEEAQSYNKGDATAKQAAQRINNRVQIYLDEQ